MPYLPVALPSPFISPFISPLPSPFAAPLPSPFAALLPSPFAAPFPSPFVSPLPSLFDSPLPSPLAWAIESAGRTPRAAPKAATAAASLSASRRLSPDCSGIDPCSSGIKAPSLKRNLTPPRNRNMVRQPTEPCSAAPTARSGASKAAGLDQHDGQQRGQQPKHRRHHQEHAELGVIGRGLHYSRAVSNLAGDDEDLIEVLGAELSRCQREVRERRHDSEKGRLQPVGRRVGDPRQHRHHGDLAQRRFQGCV